MDRLRIAGVLGRLAAERARPLPCFLEINLGAEASKHGFLETALPEALPRLAEIEGLDIRGLMAIPPQEPDETAARAWFARLARLRDRVAGALNGFGGALSMGMSGDFELAIEEGATHVRIGTALFGERKR